MPGSTAPPNGSIVWRDLTVPDAQVVRRFYAEVVGWRSEPLEGDFNMFAEGAAAPEAGICYARGPNAKLPPQWLIYITVPDIDRCVATATALGGRVIDGPRSAGNGRTCVIADPAGAIAALFQTGPG